MKVLKINNNVRIKPTEKKMKKAEQIANEISNNVLPKEMPIEKKITFISASEAFQRVKDKIQIAVDNMRGNK